MLLKNFLNLVICFLLFSQFSAAQEVIYAPYEKFDFRTGDFAVVGKVAGNTFVYHSNSDGFFLNAYNDSMDKVATVLLDFFPNKVYQSKFVAYSNKIIALYQALEGTKVTQYAALLDGSGRLVKGPINLGTERTGIFGPSKTYFTMVVSDDKKQIFIYTLDKNGNDFEVSGLWIDDELSSLQKTKATFSAENDLDCGEGVLDNQGNFYLNAYTPTGGKNFADQLWVLKLFKGSKNFIAKEYQMENKFAGSTFLKLDNVSNKLFLAGFYSSRKSGNFEGVLFAYLDNADTNFHAKRLMPFDEKLRMETGERNTKKALNNYDIKQMIIRKDGGFVMVAEDFYISTRMTNPYMGSYYGGFYSPFYSPYSNQTIREYNYNDVLAVSYDGDGNKQWHSYVRKEQFSQEDGGIFSSFVMLNTGGSLGLLFNNQNSKIEMATINGKGEVDMKTLQIVNNNNLAWMPRTGKQTGLKEVIIPCIGKQQICFAKVAF